MIVDPTVPVDAVVVDEPAAAAPVAESPAADVHVDVVTPKRVETELFTDQIPPHAPGE